RSGGSISVWSDARQRRAKPSPQPVTNVFPSGLKATAQTSFREWAIGLPMRRHVAASHNRAWESPAPVRKVLPSGLKATARTLKAKKGKERRLAVSPVFRPLSPSHG